MVTVELEQDADTSCGEEAAEAADATIVEKEKKPKRAPLRPARNATRKDDSGKRKDETGASANASRKRRKLVESSEVGSV